MDCYMCEKKYKYEKGCFITNEVHNCTDVHSRRYELELELKVKPVKKEAPKCMLCSKKSLIKKQ